MRERGENLERSRSVFVQESRPSCLSRKLDWSVYIVCSASCRPHVVYPVWNEPRVLALKLHRIPANFQAVNESCAAKSRSWPSIAVDPNMVANGADLSNFASDMYQVLQGRGSCVGAAVQATNCMPERHIMVCDRVEGKQGVRTMTVTLKVSCSLLQQGSEPCMCAGSHVPIA